MNLIFVFNVGNGSYNVMFKKFMKNFKLMVESKIDFNIYFLFDLLSYYVKVFSYVYLN